MKIDFLLTLYKRGKISLIIRVILKRVILSTNNIVFLD